MEQNIGVEQSRRLAKYEGVVSLTQADAKDILQTCWPEAPLSEVTKAAMLCAQYSLNPLMQHVFLVPFFNKKTGKNDWVRVMGIKAKRLLASRRGRYSYVDDTPRLMSEEEEVKVFGEADPRFMRAVTILKDKDGNIARGYGHWPKATSVYGEDKGNTKANMAFIRSEGAALDRLFPGEMPQGVDVVSEDFLPKVTDVAPGGEEAAGEEKAIEAEIVQKTGESKAEVPPAIEKKATGKAASEAPTESEAQRVDFLQWVLQNKPELKNEKTIREWLANVVKIEPGLIDTAPQSCYKPVVDVTGWSL